MDGIYIYIKIMVHSSFCMVDVAYTHVYIYILWDQTNPINGMNHALLLPVPELDDAKTCRPYFDCRNT